MKKTLTFIFLTLSMIMILDSINFGHSLMMFLLAGIIPGTTVILSADQMLVFFAAVTGFVCGRITMTVISSLRLRLAQYSQPKAVVPAK
jgi:hypothetical protein